MDNKKLRILDIWLVSFTLLLLLLAGVAALLHYQNSKLMVVVVTIFGLIIIALSTYRYWVAYPEFKGLRAPILVPKAVGLGWSINPRNPIGMVLIIALVVSLLGAMISALIS